MKALQKAAQNRESSGEKSHGQVATPSAPDLALQPLQAEPEAAAWKVQPEAPSPELAATVMQASEIPSGIGVYLRGHPAALLSIVAALLLIGGGIYVYLAISKPGLFVTPARPTPAPTIAAAPAPQTRPGPQTPVTVPEPQEQQGARRATPEPQQLVAGLSETPEQQGEVVATPRLQRPSQLSPRAASQQSISISLAKPAAVVDP